MSEGRHYLVINANLLSQHGETEDRLVEALDEAYGNGWELVAVSYPFHYLRRRLVPR